MNLIRQKKLICNSWLALFLLFFFSGVHAQNCPEGMVPEGGQGVASCVPVESDSQPSGHWLNQWGAIATDVPNHTGGASLNQPSEDNAKQAAISNCVSNGGSSCKVVITYVNMCVAMVAGDKGLFPYRADTIDLAVKMGAKMCTDAGDTNCRARYTSCSKAKWVQ